MSLVEADKDKHHLVILMELKVQVASIFITFLNWHVTSKKNSLLLVFQFPIVKSTLNCNQLYNSLLMAQENSKRTSARYIAKKHIQKSNIEKQL